MDEAEGLAFRVFSSQGPATADQVASLEQHFGKLPSDYIQFISAFSEVEIQNKSGQYIRIWNPKGCIDMDEGYRIRAQIPDAFPIGDDGGCHVIFYQNGIRGYGLYHVGYGNLDGSDAEWIASTLTDLLSNPLIQF